MTGLALGGQDTSRHLEGAYNFFPAQALRTSSQLRRAVFWLHLHQEIYNAFLYQRSVKTDLSDWSFDPEIDTGDDDVFFHHSLYLAAQTTKWAFGDETSRARGHELSNAVETWEHKRPANFNPIYYRSRDPEQGIYFPSIAFVTDEHVTAFHFIHLSKLLLTTHDPRIPRVGPHRKSAEHAARNYVRI